MPSVHGVLLRVDGCGVLLTGRAGSGKSSLALALIARGHALVADDAAQLGREGSALIGQCPPMLQDLLHSPSLGVINVRDAYGDTAICERTTVNLAIELCDARATAPDLDGHWGDTQIDGVTLPSLQLLPGPHLPPAVEVEAAVRVLRSTARAGGSLRARQSAAMAQTAAQAGAVGEGRACS